MCQRSHEHFVLTRTVMLLRILDKVITDLTKSPETPPVTLMNLQYEEMRIVCQSGSHNLHIDMNDLICLTLRSYYCPVLHRYTRITGRSRVGSTQTGGTGSVRTCRVSREDSNQLEVGTTSGDVGGRSDPMGHRNDG